jgi:hypothetical protein
MHLKVFKFTTIVFFVYFLIGFDFGFAHPGNTASDGCHYCRTNCDKWGVLYNKRHCHGDESLTLALPCMKNEKKYRSFAAEDEVLMEKQADGSTVIRIVGGSTKIETSSEKVDNKIIADFDTGDKPNNIGGDFGGWDKDPNDESQGTVMSFEPNDALGDPAGYSIRLDYDVDSPNPAYNGFWLKFRDFETSRCFDASQYNTFNFYIKGDSGSGFTTRLKIEMLDVNNAPSPYIISGITDQWQRVSIPFEKFKRVNDWYNLFEFHIVFDDVNSMPKSGTIYIDQIEVSLE